MSAYGIGVLDHHAAKLETSAVSVEVAHERGYVTADTKASARRHGFSEGQARPGLVIPLHDVTGERAGAQLRPDEPRYLDGKKVKYETPRGSAMVLDVPPRVRPHLADPSRPLVVTEGPIKADAAVSAGLDCVALLGVWSWRGTNDDGGKLALAAWESVALNGRRVFLAFDSDVMLNPSVHGALARLGAFLELRGAAVAYVYLPHGEAGAKVGLDDFLAAGHTAADVLDLAVPELRARASLETPEPIDTFEDVADEPGSTVLDDVRDWLTAHVAYQSEHHAPTVALWCAHTYTLDRAASTPRIAFESPEPESGKSRNLELMECVCRRGKLVLQMSAASVYRWVAAVRPTILLDETDAVFGPKASNDHEDLRALINAGHRPGATVPRVDKDSMEVVEFPCFCPVALAGLYGALPDTIRSRAIRIPMRRRAPDEVLRPFRERITRPEGEHLGRRLAAWVERHGDEIPDVPALPEGVADRQADQWEPLIAIADAAGGHWPTTARAACRAIVTEARANTEDQSLGIRLLADVYTVFDTEGERITSAHLLNCLHAMDDAPWSDLKGKPIGARFLADLLKPYGIRPRDHRFGDAIRKGYLAEDFHEAWVRYNIIPPPNGNMGNMGNAPASDVADVADVADRDNGEVVEAPRKRIVF
jgi:Protein of unknown function (DUF3631)/Domain of unknown function (DUF3854)